MPRGGPERKRVLIVNVYLDDPRAPSGRITTVLKAVAPPMLAGALDPARCEVRLWDEQTGGALHDAHQLAWADMLVLTGLTSNFDRMLHLTAYARTLNPRVVVVAGGSAVRALARYARRFFDYVCTGDVEELGAVAREVFGHAADAPAAGTPRWALAPWLAGAIGYAEASRNCNFACSFCSLTAEARPYARYDLAAVRRQIVAGGRRRLLVFVDNNFFGPDRASFDGLIAMLATLREQGWFGGWAALVTEDFFADPALLARARRAGCEALFTGVESFDATSLTRFNKRQNLRAPQAQMIRGCLAAGVLLLYGLILDVRTRPLAALRAELAALLAEPSLTLPSFLALPVPYPGTPMLRQYVRERALLPRTRLRDLDGTTLCVAPCDPLAEVARFVRDAQTLAGLRTRVVAHALGFVAHHRRTLGAAQLGAAIARDLALAGLTPRAARRLPRTHVSTTEQRFDAYDTPALPVDARYASHFAPTPVTDAGGELVAHLADEYLGASAV